MRGEYRLGIAHIYLALSVACRVSNPKEVLAWRNASYESIDNVFSITGKSTRLVPDIHERFPHRRFPRIFLSVGPIGA